MIERSIPFRYEHCRWSLYMPAAMIEMPLANLRKLFKWIYQELWNNEESIQQFFSYVPEILDDLKDKWDSASRDFQKNYLSPDFDSHGNKITDKNEIKHRKEYNNRLLKNVKDAKAKYERFQKRIPKLEELREQIRI